MTIDESSCQLVTTPFALVKNMFGLEEHHYHHKDTLATRKDVHVLCLEGKWIVTTAGTDETYFDSLAEAEDFGRKIACREMSKFFVHTEDGQVIMKDCYEHEPLESSA